MDAHIQDLFATALASGLNHSDVKKTANIKKSTKAKLVKKPFDFRYASYTIGFISILIVLGLPLPAYKRPIQHFKQVFADYVYDSESQCLVSHGGATIELTRPVAKCNICKGITEVPVFYNMTKEYFVKHHAYSGIPVLIKKGTGNWTALSVFSYKYFKKLYTKTKSLDEFDEKECQFFGYKTNLRTLKHVFTMSKKRSELKKDQWYIGWSNCIPKVQNILRKHYSRPAFLPDDSESSSLDWIFMGGSGNGALMHIDSVNRPSWQAMITGKKTWYFEPPPECEFECPRHLNATMEPGDILIADTNRWYHSTFIHPGDLAITIGSEYD